MNDDDVPTFQIVFLVAVIIFSASVCYVMGSEESNSAESFDEPETHTVTCYTWTSNGTPGVMCFGDSDINFRFNPETNASFYGNASLVSEPVNKSDD